ncbi:MAG: hypothetical protein ACPGVY_14520 [Mycobacterium sp.]
MPLSRINSLFAEIETNKGVRATVQGSDAIAVVNPLFNGPEHEFIDDNDARDDLDKAGSTPGRATAAPTFTTKARGSGDAASTAPETDKLFRVSGMQRANVGALDVEMTTGRLAIGQEYEDTTGGARFVALRPWGSGDAVPAVVAMTDDAGTLIDNGNISVVTGPTLAQGLKNAASASYVASGFGYRPESSSTFQHDIGSFSGTVPIVGDVVVYKRQTTTEYIGFGLVVAIVDGTSITVDLNQTDGTQATPIGAGDTIHLGKDESSGTSVSGTPTTLQGASLTAQLYSDGELQELVGGKGTFQFEVEAGQSGRFNWTLRGTPLNPTDAPSLVASGLPTTVAPRFINGYGEINGIRFVTKKFTLDYGNELVDELDGNSPSGATGAVITDRTITANWEIKFPGVHAGSYADFYKLMREGGDLFGGLLLGSATGNEISIVAPRMQLKSVGRVDHDGVKGLDLQMDVLARAAAGSRDESLFIAYL